MSRILIDLFNGNLEPHSKVEDNDQRCKNLRLLIERHFDTLQVGLCGEYFCIFTNCHLSLQNPTDKGFSIFCFHESLLIATYCHGQMS